MKKLSVISAVLLLLTLPQVGHAADLQAGWYAKINSLYAFTKGSGGPPVLNEGEFYQTPPGDYGPFRVSDLVGTTHVNFARFVSIPTAASGVGSEQSLTMPVTIAGLAQGTAVQYLEIAWATNYDATQTFLGLYDAHSDGTAECLWTQKASGIQGSGGLFLAYNTTFDGYYYFAVNVVPEPSGAVCVLFGCAPILYFAKRRAA